MDGQWYGGPVRAGPTGERSREVGVGPVGVGSVGGTEWMAGASPKWSSPVRRRRPHHGAMSVHAAARRHPATASARAIAVSLVVGTVFVAGGLLIGYATWGTGFVTQFTTPRPTTVQMAAGALAWTFALIAPGVFLVVGLARLAETAGMVASRRRRPKPAARVAHALSDEHVILTRVRLPDGRVVPELVVGPFGVAVIEELPPPSASRRHGTAWEVRVADGRWMPIESPLDRAARDAERIRGWIAHEEHDHVVKVYAAVIGKPEALPRTPTCAVVDDASLPAWLASLPPQRSLNPDRRTRIAAFLGRSMV